MLLVENENRELLVYNEYRHGIEEVSYTFPAGGIEKEETIKDTAKRELLEEMGYEFKDYKLINKYVVSGSYMFSELNFVSIKGIKKIREPSNVDIENPEYLWLKKDLVVSAIKENKFKGLTYVTAALAWLFYYEEEK